MQSKNVLPFKLLASNSLCLTGVGFAFNAPALSSVVSEVVSKEELASAVTLGGLQLNSILNLPQPDDGPVTITLDFHIHAADRARFIALEARSQAHALAQRCVQLASRPSHDAKARLVARLYAMSALGIRGCVEYA